MIYIPQTNKVFLSKKIQCMFLNLQITYFFIKFLNKNARFCRGSKTELVGCLQIEILKNCVSAALSCVLKRFRFRKVSKRKEMFENGVSIQRKFI